tara:strand:+ start:1821 stop:2651 length:831 start_codon:yes stop_codon:yes gene_type:complete
MTKLTKTQMETEINRLKTENEVLNNECNMLSNPDNEMLIRSLVMNFSFEGTVWDSDERREVLGNRVQFEQKGFIMSLCKGINYQRNSLAVRHEQRKEELKAAYRQRESVKGGYAYERATKYRKNVEFALNEMERLLAAAVDVHNDVTGEYFAVQAPEYRDNSPMLKTENTKMDERQEQRLALADAENADLIAEMMVEADKRIEAKNLGPNGNSVQDYLDSIQDPHYQQDPRFTDGVSTTENDEIDIANGTINDDILDGKGYTISDADNAMFDRKTG